MRIILLSGNPHSGKTPTLNMVFNKLTTGMNPLPLRSPISNSSPNDFECRFMYQSPVTNKQEDVAIFSLGDWIYRITEAIFKYSTVDVLILAHSRCGSDSITFATNMAQFPQHCVIPKTTNNNSDCAAIVAKV
jgi:hypothetical protein